jgi:protein-disulfide isomerase
LPFRPLLLAALAAVVARPAGAQMRVQLAERVVSLDGFGIEKGKPGAPVWIVELADFGCGYCAKFAFETMPTLDSLYTRSGRVYWRFVPFVIGMFPNSKEAAKGSLCAAEQGKFWPMHDKLYTNRKAWMASRAPVSLIARYASETGVDPARYGRCVKGKEVSETVERNNALARSLFVRGTPTFVINGEIVPGALPTDIFVKGLGAVYDAATARGTPRRP